MGFYPSNLEMDDLINEVKYSRFAEGEGEEVNKITFGELIKCNLLSHYEIDTDIVVYLNHRPVHDVSFEDIEIALSHARRLEPGKPLPSGPVMKMIASQSVKQSGLMALLQQFGKNDAFVS